MPRPKKLKPIEHIKIGRRIYGGIYEVPSGEKLFLAYKRQKDIYKMGAANLSSAIRDRIAAWGLDYETLVAMKSQDIKYCGILILGSGHVWLSTVERFLTPSRVEFLDYENSRRRMQKLIGFTDCRYRQVSSIGK